MRTMNNYPPYELTNEMLDLVAEIMEKIGKLNMTDEFHQTPRLRKVNRIKSIHSSLAIENNTLSIEQVTDLINGKRVIGPKDDITAVYNANLAYQELSNINPFDIDDLLKIHGIMMDGLVSESGKIRSGGVGVYNEKGEVVHLAPPARFVPTHLNNLFDWLKNSNVNMLIKSSVFHYEFEFIHPFSDGNGRMGRLWQTALLTKWKTNFMWIPIENIIKNHQEDYYNAITYSTSEGKSNIFIVFMLKMINKAIDDIIVQVSNHQNHLSTQISELMKVIDSYPQSALEIMTKLKLKSRISFRENYLNPALKAGLIKMTEPDKPTSRNQKYYKS